MSHNLENNAFLITDHAARQILLIQENDYTLAGMVFRLKIGGKGCSGFTYDTGFSEVLEKDTVFKRVFDFGEVYIHMDEFTHYYCNDGLLDYLFDPDNNEDGFLFQNNKEHLFEGKFFKDEALVPPKHMEI